MDSLAGQYVELEQSSILERYAFIPSHPQPISYVTANFLRGGWLHIIGNMWFLWLAGAILEDTWGRIMYPIFFLVSGAMAIHLFPLANSGRLIPSLGGSGPVAALMSTSLAPLPSTNIHTPLTFALRFTAHTFH